jgi:hypothetical protein
MADAEQLARKFHEVYERLAPSFGYETRKETRAFDPTTPNGRLMIAVCAEIAQDLAAPQAPVTRADCDGTNALLRHAQSLTAPAPQDQSAPTPAPISSAIGDHGAQATADPGADPNAEWNAACEACANQLQNWPSRYVIDRAVCAAACRALKREGK